MVGQYFNDVKDSLTKQRAEKIMSSIQANLSNKFSDSFTKKGKSQEK
jgi:hypothetical protein